MLTRGRMLDEILRVFSGWTTFRRKTRPQAALILHAIDAGITHFGLANNCGPSPAALARGSPRSLAGRGGSTSTEN